MLGDGKRGTVEVLNGMTVLAFIQIRRSRKLTVVSILMAIRAGSEFHLVNRIFTGGQMAFAAFDGDVLALQWILGSVVFLHSKK
jgi:hypothetical protein